MEERMRRYHSPVVTGRILWRYRFTAVLLLVFSAFAHLRFAEPETRAVFGYDQVTNAWVMRAMIRYGNLPLVGMVAKGSSGFYIGPLYYYLMAPFFWVYNLDPRAAMAFVGVVSIGTFWVLYGTVSRLLGKGTGLLSVILYTFSYGALSADRVPWPVVFIPMASAAVYYFLYRVLTGEPRFLVPLAACIGMAFHIHFTAVYFVIATVLCSPWIMRQKRVWKYIVVAVPVFLVWFIPNIAADASGRYHNGTNLIGYLGTYFHGFHLRRVLQLTHDGLIEYVTVLFDGLSGSFPAIGRLSHVLDIPFLLAFHALLITDKNRNRNDRIVISLLSLMWIGIPWTVMAMYRGEISSYYFSTGRPVIVFMLGYLLWRAYELRLAGKLAVIAVVLLFGCIQLSYYWAHSGSPLPFQREAAKAAVRDGREIRYVDGLPEPYLYEYYSTVGRSLVGD